MHDSTDQGKNERGRFIGNGKTKDKERVEEEIRNNLMKWQDEEEKREEKEIQC